MVMTTTRARSEARAEGRYLYAIINAGEARTDFAFSGLEGAGVYALGDGQVAAVISDVPDRQFRPGPRRLSAHLEVLRRLMPHHVVLPMAFGQVADGSEAIRRLLQLNGAAFEAKIRRVRGQVVLGLRVLWDVPNLCVSLVAAHPGLGVFRNHMFHGGRQPSREEKIELGRVIDQTLANDRDAVLRHITRALRPLCDEIKEHGPQNPREVLNLACLIDRTRQEEFAQRVIDAANDLDSSYAFDLNGPWSPHNFVTIDLQMT